MVSPRMVFPALLRQPQNFDAETAGFATRHSLNAAVLWVCGHTRVIEPKAVISKSVCRWRKQYSPQPWRFYLLH